MRNTIENFKKFRKFDNVVDHFIVLDDPSDRIGIVFEFRFGNGLGVSVADHSGINANDLEMVSVAIVDPTTDFDRIINDNEKIDNFFGTQGGVIFLHRTEVKDFLSKVKDISVLDFV